VSHAEVKVAEVDDGIDDQSSSFAKQQEAEHELEAVETTTDEV
jgi:hypothetical protein